MSRNKVKLILFCVVSGLVIGYSVIYDSMHQTSDWSSFLMALFLPTFFYLMIRWFNDGDI